MPLETLLLSQKDIERLVTVRDAIGIVEDVYRGHGEGTVVMPPKLSMDLGESGRWPHHNSFINAMPAYIGRYRTAGVKIVGGFLSNVGAGRPSIRGLIVLIDPESGSILSLMDGTYITSLRTGASVAVGAKYLARPGARAVTLIGAGVQARYCLRALASVLKLDRAIVTDLRGEAAARFADEMSGELSFDLKAASDEVEIYASDVIVSATTSKTPVIHGKMLRTGTLVEPIGSYQEIDRDVVSRAATVVVDNVEQAEHRGSLASLIERGEVAPEVISGEISEVVTGKAKGRGSQDDIVVFAPIGLGSTDIATACFAYERAKRESVGATYEFS